MLTTTVLLLIGICLMARKEAKATLRVPTRGANGTAPGSVQVGTSGSLSLFSNLVKVGQKVKRGDTIAISGSTDMTTGPHLHYEVWKRGTHVNLIAFLEEKP